MIKVTADPFLFQVVLAADEKAIRANKGLRSIKEEHRAMALLFALERIRYAMLVKNFPGERCRFTPSHKAYTEMRLNMFSMTPRDLVSAKNILPFLYEFEIEEFEMNAGIADSRLRLDEQGLTWWWQELGFVVAELAMKMITIVGVTLRGDLAYRELSRDGGREPVRFTLCEDLRPNDTIFELGASPLREATGRSLEMCVVWPIRSILGGRACATEPYPQI